MKYKFGDIFHIVDGDRGANYPKEGDFFDEGYCLFLNAGNVTKTGWSFNKVNFITKEKDSQLRKGRVERGNTVLTTRGTVGNAAYYGNNIKYDHIRINSGMVILKAKDKQIIDDGFIYYLVTSPIAKKTIELFCSGSAQPQLPIKDFVKIKYDLPSLKIQKKIVSIIGSYDNLIENNNKRICLLEQMAENLYKEWFVRFRFPGHEKAEFENGLPKGWRLENLFDVADVSYGYAFKSDMFCTDDSLNAVVRIRDIQENHTDTYTSEVCDDKYLIEENAILVGMDGLFHMCLWNGDKAYLNQRVVKICSKKKNMCNYMLFMAIRPQIKFWEQVIAGTTVAHLGDKHLKKIKIAFPTEDILLKANESILKLMVEKNQLFKQNSLLSRQRDLLLPRLMSGKLEVK